MSPEEALLLAATARAVSIVADLLPLAIMALVALVHRVAFARPGSTAARASTGGRVV